ncbi:hypothetical protein FOCC_FOCC007102 [Frankliniella occidentalis]|nr:hypothetical protein FOCC_FOCC007102 [Frankliniella occidentalis]
MSEAEELVRSVLRAHNCSALAARALELRALEARVEATRAGLQECARFCAVYMHGLLHIAFKDVAELDECHWQSTEAGVLVDTDVEEALLATAALVEGQLARGLLDNYQVESASFVSMLRIIARQRDDSGQKAVVNLIKLIWPQQEIGTRLGLGASGEEVKYGIKNNRILLLLLNLNITFCQFVSKVGNVRNQQIKSSKLKSEPDTKYR